MSTAHRPTWNPAHGGDSQSGNRFLAPRTAFSVKDLPRHLTVKHRQPSQRPLSAEELKRKLEEREQQHAAGGAGGVAKVPRFDAKPAAEQLLDFSALDDPSVGGAALSAIVDPADADDVALVQRNSRGATGVSAGFGGEDDDDDYVGASGAGPSNGAAGAASDEDEEDEDDEEDETEELMRELERIKRERAAEAARAAAESEELASAEREEAILHGNPLVQAPGLGAGGPSSFTVKRRWDDDVVFRNQARKPEKSEPTFINDTLRTDFHKRFLKKYVK